MNETNYFVGLGKIWGRGGYLDVLLLSEEAILCSAKHRVLVEDDTVDSNCLRC